MRVQHEGELHLLSAENLPEGESASGNPKSPCSSDAIEHLSVLSPLTPSPISERLWPFGNETEDINLLVGYNL